MLPVFPNPATHVDKQPLSEPIHLVQLDPLLPDQVSMSSYPYLSLPYNLSLPTFSRPRGLNNPPLPFGAAAALAPQPCPQVSMVAAFSAPPLVMMSKMRAHRKDRHSKIVTAKGPRDRRIRLSRDVARSFFDLQEVLGFDHGSKTVQWLLTMSKHAIEGLDSTTSKSTSTTSSSPAQIPNFSNLFNTSSMIVSDDCKGKFIPDADEYPKKSKSSIAAPNTLIDARESRAKARARARERATEKKQNNASSSSHAAAAAAELDHSGSLHLDSSLIEYSMPQFVVEEGCPAAAAISTSFDHDQDGSGDHLVPFFDNWIADLTYDMDYIFQQQDMEMHPSSLDPFN